MLSKIWSWLINFKAYPKDIEPILNLSGNYSDFSKYLEKYSTYPY